MLSKLGRQRESREKLQETVDIYRELADRKPQLYKSRLASCLSNLARKLAKIKRAEAIALIKEAIEIYEELAKESPKEFKPRLVSSRDFLSSVQSRSGRENRR